LAKMSATFAVQVNDRGWSLWCVMNVAMVAMR